jgi:hypothetical protein
MSMTYITLLMVVGSVFMPTGLAVAIFWGYRKWQDRDGRRSPIQGRPIYGAGQQLRKRIDKLDDEIMGSLTLLFFLGPYFLAFWALQRINWSHVTLGFGDYLLIGIFLIMCGGAIWRIFKSGRERRIANAGLEAELYTAQELNRLMGLGCTVLHDIPADGFNIDHVVIGPGAVYAVETKSVRKPRANDAKDHFKVSYDGQRLRFPDFSGSKPLKQAKRQSDWLADYLRQATGRPIPVFPALALPGWWIAPISASASADVRVFNPAGRGAHFMADRNASTVDAGTIALITQALVMRYPADNLARK